MDVTPYLKVAHKGAQWLDTIEPGWEKRISRRCLNMNDPWSCIAGQVFGDGSYTSGYERLIEKLAPSYNGEASRWLIKYGFCTGHILGADTSDPYQLRRAWLREVAARLKES